MPEALVSLCRYREGKKRCPWWDPKQTVCLNPNPDINPDSTCQEEVEDAGSEAPKRRD